MIFDSLTCAFTVSPVFATNDSENDTADHAHAHADHEDALVEHADAPEDVPDEAVCPPCAEQPEDLFSSSQQPS